MVQDSAQMQLVSIYDDPVAGKTTKRYCDNDATGALYFIYEHESPTEQQRRAVDATDLTTTPNPRPPRDSNCNMSGNHPFQNSDVSLRRRAKLATGERPDCFSSTPHAKKQPVTRFLTHFEIAFFFMARFQ